MESRVITCARRLVFIYVADANLWESTPRSFDRAILFSLVASLAGLTVMHKFIDAPIDPTDTLILFGKAVIPNRRVCMYFRLFRREISERHTRCHSIRGNKKSGPSRSRSRRRRRRRLQIKVARLSGTRSSRNWSRASPRDKFNAVARNNLRRGPKYSGPIGLIASFSRARARA